MKVIILSNKSIVSLVAGSYMRVVNGIQTFSGLFVRIYTFTLCMYPCDKVQGFDSRRDADMLAKRIAAVLLTRTLLAVIEGSIELLTCQRPDMSETLTCQRR